MKERDAALDKLRAQQKDFTARLNATLQQVKDFRFKERMGEAEKYVAELQQIGEAVKQYEEEVRQSFVQPASDLDCKKISFCENL